VNEAPAPRPRRGRGLRFRVTTAFALGSLGLAAVLIGVTYLVSEHYLVRQREKSLIRQAYVDARVFRDELRRRPVEAALDAIERPSGAKIVVSVGDRWFGTSRRAATRVIPADLRRRVDEGTPAHQRVRRQGDARLVVGLPMQAVGVQYFETYTLTELERTLRVIRTGLLAGGVIAIALAGLLGFWMSRRVLMPVTDFAAAAQQVASGDLGTRLDLHDDPDLDSLAASFNEMVDSVQHRIERETRFVADVSHELRSPLTALATASQLLAARRDELPERSREALDLLEHEIERMQQLVEDLLELGSADAGVAQLDLGPVDMRELVQEAVDPGGHHGTVVRVDDAITSSRVLVDKRRLERVLANLVANAETHGEGVTAVVVGRRNGVLRIEVEDAGPGVGPGEQDAVFQRFFRGAVSGRRASSSGAGLGLALVAEQVQLHGGRVWVQEASPSGGARFVVELPWRAP
jgi:signal transduction histidine kinase